MIEKKNRKKKNESGDSEEILLTLPETKPDYSTLMQRFGAVAFVENIAPEEDEETDILSLETLRDAFANISEENQPFSENEEEEFLPYDLDDDTSEAETDIAAESENEQTLSPRTIIEAMLFVGDRNNRPLSPFRAAEKMRNVSPEEIDEVIISLNQDYQQFGCPYTIIKESDGYRMVLRSEFDPILAKFYGKIREAKLSQQAIDTLAVVAYRQPISAEEVQKIRKQPSSALLNQLVRRGLLGVEREIRDRKKIMLYRTTDRFLELFQLDSIDDLPISEELDFRGGL
ncbi:MAG: SMC-Scp complex subunit ScpB [Planctomycetaceae bacterium]|jgi:segregation and condensation protein B|nr:SMC-Scp complex subunit ScpB [Planctomycetaceae bacterium]